MALKPQVNWEKKKKGHDLHESYACDVVTVMGRKWPHEAGKNNKVSYSTKQREHGGRQSSATWLNPNFAPRVPSWETHKSSKVGKEDDLEEKERFLG